MEWIDEMQNKKIIDIVTNPNKKIEYVCFDFFDTIVHRKCTHDTIKQLWSLEVEKELGYMITAKELYQIRIDSEKFLHNKNIEEDYKILSHEIYKRLLNSGYISDKDNIEKYTLLMKYVEIKIEKLMQYRDDSINNLLFELKKRNLHVIIISDFYLDKHCIKEFCENCGIEYCFEEIFVSCDYGRGKSEGGLFAVYKQHVAGEKYLHIGDNRRSDM